MHVRPYGVVLSAEMPHQSICFPHEAKQALPLSQRSSVASIGPNGTLLGASEAMHLCLAPDPFLISLVRMPWLFIRRNFKCIGPIEQVVDLACFCMHCWATVPQL